MRLALLLGLVATTAQAKRLAVLELRDPAELPAQEVAWLADVARAEALSLPPDRWLVMTRENIEALLPPGTPLEACVGACEIETGRNLGADVVLTGEVVRFGGELRLALRLYDTRDGRLLSSASAAGATVVALEPEVRKAAQTALAVLNPPAVPDVAIRLDPQPSELHGDRVWAGIVRLQAAKRFRERARAETRDRMWTRVSRMLRMDLLPAEEKRRLALAFLQAYGYDPDRNPYVRDLIPHAFLAVPPGPYARPTDAALAASVGRFLRVGTPMGDVEGFLRGFDGVTVVVETGDRFVAVRADDIRRVAILSSW